MMHDNPVALDRGDSDPGAVTYVYRGRCPVTGQMLTLPRTARAERLVSALRATLPPLAEGKMIGVLIVETCDGPRVLKAFSGLWEGCATHEGWVPPIGGDPPASTEYTLQKLEELKDQLRGLLSHDVAARLTEMNHTWDIAQSALDMKLAENRVRRQAMRANGADGRELDDQSRRDSRERRLFKQARAEAVAPLAERAASLQAEIISVKRERRRLSRALQAEMHADFARTLTRNQPWSLASLFPSGLPTGTGDCCAPRLLYHAAINGWTPVEMAEMWCGAPSPNGQRQPGVFYGACENRCQPLLGPLLSRQSPALSILHADRHLLAVVKPPGLLTVPGREHWKHDSLLTRVQRLHAEARAVHRLDLETSGIVLFALDARTHAHLQRQFAERRMDKIYHAWLIKHPAAPEGCVELALARDPEKPGRYRPDPVGRPSRTFYRVIAESQVELRPQTGRSHQLRVHMAAGLGCPIRGDRLYGDAVAADARLFLHASALRFQHPASGENVSLEAPPPWMA